MRLEWISLAATTVTTVAQTGWGAKSIEKLSKPLIVTPFLCAKHKDPLFIVGCLTHLAGDVELMRATASVHRGAAYFGIGHIAFLLRAVRQGKRPRFPWLYTAVVAGMIPVIKDPKLIVYSAVLAAYCSVAEPVGGTLFMVSDALIDLSQKHPNRLYDVALMATYGLAQYRLLSEQSGSTQC